jgi:hypothetical protein
MYEITLLEAEFCSAVAPAFSWRHFLHCLQEGEDQSEKTVLFIKEQWRSEFLMKLDFLDQGSRQ